MSKPKSQRRLVSREEYFQTVRKKSSLYSLSGAAVGLGLFCLFASASNAWFCLWEFHRDIGAYFLWNGGLAVFGLATMVWGRFVFKYTREMERVTLITRHNTAYLPDIETLVRGSTQPSTAPQTELLRAAASTTDTRPEQLLRAMQEN